jgi:hypothetical protein
MLWDALAKNKKPTAAPAQASPSRITTPKAMTIITTVPPLPDAFVGGPE